MAVKLYQDGDEYEGSRTKALRNEFTPSSSRYPLISFYLHSAGWKKMFEEHEAYIASNI